MPLTHIPPSGMNGRPWSARSSTTLNSWRGIYVWASAHSAIRLCGGQLSRHFCAPAVYPSPAKRGDSFSIEASPYAYISESDRVQDDIVKKSSLTSDGEQSDFLENDIGKDWLAFEEGFIRQQSVLDPNFYYTYSNTLNAQLYMNVDYELTEQKTIKLKEKENTYQITYYTYIYDQSAPIFEKHVVEVPISQVTLIEYT